MFNAILKPITDIREMDIDVCLRMAYWSGISFLLFSYCAIPCVQEKLASGYSLEKPLAGQFDHPEIAERQQLALDLFILCLLSWNESIP